MKFSKEIKTGIIVIVAITLLVTGVNFLKGNSFFGGDDVYYAYFPDSGGVLPASNVIVNGVIVGKVLTVELTDDSDSLKRVLISFNIQDDNFKLSKGTVIEVGSLDLFNKGMTIIPSKSIKNGFYEPGDYIQGFVHIDMLSEVKTYVEPLKDKITTMLGSVDKVINSLSAFWDTSATSSIENSMEEVKTAIKRFGNVAVQVETLVAEEKVQLHRVLSNVESITQNLKASNENIASIIGNTKKISDDMVTADFKSVVADAQKVMKTLNAALEDASNGKGSLGMLLKDEQLYNELVNTNKELQNLVNDLQLHPERYIHFSVLGAKSKGVPLTTDEEKKLRKLLESTPNQ
jgi:phospholipid/cholesterol/gamma-HCH transport system substrate-binding protein